MTAGNPSIWGAAAVIENVNELRWCVIPLIVRSGIRTIRGIRSIPINSHLHRPPYSAQTPLYIFCNSMQIIHGILFEPVGCLAEFSPEPFNEMAILVSGRESKPSRSASRTYWHLLNLMEATGMRLSESEITQIEDLELQAVETASVYEDVVPALSELNAMRINLVMASSLSRAAATRFIERAGLDGLFAAVSSRDRAEEVRAAPLRKALTTAGLEAEDGMFITHTADGWDVGDKFGM